MTSAGPELQSLRFAARRGSRVFDRFRSLSGDVKGILHFFVSRHVQARDYPREDIVVFKEGVESNGDFIGESIASALEDGGHAVRLVFNAFCE